MTTPKRLAPFIYTLPILFFLLISGFQPLIAQSSFIATANYDYNSLTSEEQGNYSKISGINTLTNLKFIELADFLTSTSNGDLTISLPELECSSVTYLARYVEYTNADNYVWSGYLNASLSSCNIGNFVLANINGKVTGMFNIQDDNFFIHDIGNGKYVLTNLLNFEGDTKTCAHETAATVEPEESFYVSEENPEHRAVACKTKIIVFYDPDIDYVSAGFPATTQEEFENVVEFKMLLLNIITRGSDLQNVRYDLVAVEPLPGPVAPFPGSLDYINSFQSSSMVQQQKVAHQADIAVLLTAGDTPDAFGRVFELLPSDPENAVALVRLSHESIRRWTFAHEISHIYGAGHDNLEPAVAVQPYARARIFGNGIPFADPFYTTDARAASSEEDPFPRILHFSNPDVRFFLWRTGTKERNNARMIRENSCAVSQLEVPEPAPINAGLKAPHSACACQDITVTFTGDLAVQYTSYNWYRSYNGTTFGSPFSHQVGMVEVAMPCVPEKKVWVRLIVQDVFGNEYLYEKSILATPADPEGAPCELRKSNEAIGNATNTAGLYPNPATDILNIVKGKYYSTRAFHWEIINISGTIVDSGERSRSDAEQTFTIDISKLLAGVYFLKLENADRSKELKFIKH